MESPVPTLCLRVTRLDGRPSAPGQLKVFDDRGGTLGRAPGNDWILPDPARVLSAHHATVFFEQGQYRLVDCSTNGVFVNDDDQPLGASRIADLHDGDRLQLGDYEMVVAIGASTPVAALAVRSGTAGRTPLDPLQLLQASRAAPEPAAPRPAPSLAQPWFDTGRLSSVVDPLALLGGACAPGLAHAAVEAVPRDDTPMLASFFQPPAAAVPEDWFAPPPAAGATAAPQAERAATTSASGDAHRPALDALLRAAGLDPDRVPQTDPLHTLATCGALLRESLAALRELLLLRASTRQQLGLVGTCIAPRANNALKFSARGVEQAIDSFLFDDGPQCMGPIEAVRATLADLKAERDDELASLRQHFGSALDRLAPRAIEQACQAAPRRRLLSASSASPATCWALYAARYAETRKALDARPAAGTPPRRRVAAIALDTTEAGHGLE